MAKRNKRILCIEVCNECKHLRYYDGKLLCAIKNSDKVEDDLGYAEIKKSTCKNCEFKRLDGIAYNDAVTKIAAEIHDKCTTIPDYICMKLGEAAIKALLKR